MSAASNATARRSPYTRRCSATACSPQIPGSPIARRAPSCSYGRNPATGRHAELVERIGTFVGYGCVTICNAFNPSRIVIGDIVAQAGEPLLQRVREVACERVIPEIMQSTQIELSALPTDAAVTGAAAVAITYILDHPSQFFANGT